MTAPTAPTGPSQPVPHAALLRGVNVGGHRRVPMAELRALLTGLGLGGVRTYLQSGNVVFTAPERPADERAADLTAAMAERFGFEVGCLVLSRAQLAAAVARCPFPADELDPSRLMVVFLDGPPGDHPVARADPARFAPDEFRVGEREIFAYYPHGSGRSRLGQALAAPGRGFTATARNWRTVTRLLELMAQE
ncbi:DUF1697 domain-containing protein [Streptomyces sp. 4N509B]|uniref:DUF1697 domain-containing protein n=1 Tax=Streptomyces sp. 4N509B TaxID=3457413 RepID=UPI003FD545CE